MSRAGGAGTLSDLDQRIDLREPEIEVRATERIAVVHEWITQRAGSEKTFEQLAATLPGADLFALTHTDGIEIETGGRPITTTVLNRSRLLSDRRALALPLMPLAWRFASQETYDTVITSSHACAKGFGPARAALHLCYCHAPMRYAWNSSIDGRTAGPIDLLAPARSVMRRWDHRSADWVDSFAANSTAVAERIAIFYGREARVISPPVDVGFFSDAPRRARTHLLAFSRFISYKRLDIAIGVSRQLEIPLVIAGSGPDEGQLRAEAERLAPGLVTFAIRPDQHELRELYASSLALLFPAHEDFGIIPVEAQAADCPVVGLAKGGSLDTVSHGVSGLLVEDQTIEAFADATTRLLNNPPAQWACQRNAANFGEHRFRREIREWLADVSTGS